MSTLDERRDVFWKAKAKKFATERDAEAHRRKETETRLADVTGDRGTILKRFRSTLCWARAWKDIAKIYYMMYHHQRILRKKYYELTKNRSNRTVKLEQGLKDLVDKLDLVEPIVKGWAVLAHVHGQRYDGPTYGKELEHAKTLLKKEKKP